MIVQCTSRWAVACPVWKGWAGKSGPFDYYIRLRLSLRLHLRLRLRPTTATTATR